MYCPVDGTEFREGVTRCPDHDVELVDEPLELEEDDPPLLDSINDRSAVRLAFYVLLGAAAVYAVSGVVFGVMLWIPSWRESTEGAAELVFRVTQGLNGGAWTVGTAALGALAGAVLVRAYSSLRGAPSPASPEPPGPGENAVRLLFALVIVFSVLWALTGVATAWDNAEYFAGFGFDSPEEPSQTFVALTALHSAAYACSVGSFAVMGALLMKRTLGRIAVRAGNSSRFD